LGVKTNGEGGESPGLHKPKARKVGDTLAVPRLGLDALGAAGPLFQEKQKAALGKNPGRLFYNGNYEI